MRTSVTPRGHARPGDRAVGGHLVAGASGGIRLVERELEARDLREATRHEPLSGIDRAQADAVLERLPELGAGDVARLEVVGEGQHGVHVAEDEVVRRRPRSPAHVAMVVCVGVPVRPIEAVVDGRVVARRELRADAAAGHVADLDVVGLRMPSATRSPSGISWRRSMLPPRSNGWVVVPIMPSRGTASSARYGCEHVEDRLVAVRGRPARRSCCRAPSAPAGPGDHELDRLADDARARCRAGR